MTGKVSVCMATYNGGKFIQEQISSILRQLNAEDELIISDDASSDNTIETIKLFKDNRIKLFINPFPRSATRNFENALRHAVGETIFLADQDDIWYAGKVTIMKEYLESYDLAVSDCNFIDSNGQIVGESFFRSYMSGQGIIKNFYKNTFLGNCMAFNRRVLERILPFPEELHRATRFMIYQDVWIGLLANSLFKVKFIPQILSGFRRHSQNASPTELNLPSPQSLRSKLRGRSLLAVGLAKRIVQFS